MPESRFETQRTRLLSQYAAAGQAYIASTKPYKSTLPLVFDVVDAFGNNGAGAIDPNNPTIAMAVARKGQELDFFAYGVGDQIANGATGASAGSRKATEADTNLGKAKSTNGAEDYVIEGVSFGCKGIRVQNSAFLLQMAANLGTSPDADVQAMCAGTATLGADSFGAYAPAQVMGALTLENALLQGVIGCMSLEFEWDRDRTEKISTVDLLPEGGARSYLRANGQPAASNRYRIPEGYVWRRDGQPDSEFIARVTLVEPVVVPIIIAPNPYNLGNATDKHSTPDRIILDVAMRVHGLGVKLPSRN